MYTIDHRDRVVERTDLPQSSVGAPCPMVLASGQSLLLAYYLQETPAVWDRSTVRAVDENSSNEPCALVRFTSPVAHMFGPPNDEVFSGHPLASRGLEPYGVFEVAQSSWIRGLEKMNSVHPHHRPERYRQLKHFIFAFHDDTLECVAEGFELSTHRGSVSSVLLASRLASGGG